MEDELQQVVVPRDLLEEIVESLDMAGCRFWACKGPTLTPVNMTTCHRCAALARARQLIGLPVEDQP